MSAAPTEVDIELKDLEARLERLRSLYEQYFIGIERLEPTIPRKDVDRRIAALTRSRLRNTAKRFKLQTLVQRYNSYQQYWMRTCREIENGTYARHVARAKNRFGDVPGVGKARGVAAERDRKAAEMKADATRSAEEDLQSLLHEDLSSALDAILGPDSQSQRATQAPAHLRQGAGSVHADAKLPAEREPVTLPRAPQPTVGSERVQTIENTVQEPSPRAARERLAEALSANPPRRRSSASSETRAAPVPVGQAPAGKHRAQPPPLKSSRMQVGLASSPGKPESVPHAVEASSPSPRRPGATAEAIAQARARTTGASPTPPGVTQGAASPAAPGPSKSDSSASSAKPRTEKAIPLTKRVDAGRLDKPRSQPRRPPPPVAPSPAAAPSALTGGRLDALHQSLVAERGRLQQRGRVSRDALEQSLRATEAKLRDQYKDKAIDFRVVVKDGKAVVKPVIG